MARKKTTETAVIEETSAVETTETAVEEPKYSKGAIIRTAKYIRYIDLLSASLKEGVKYTLSEVDAIIGIKE